MEDAIGKNLEVFVTKTEAQATASDFVAAHPAALCISSDTKSIVFGGQVLTLGDHQAKVNKWVDEKRVLKLNGLEAVGSATINSTTTAATSTDQLIWATDKKAVYLKRDGQYYNNWTEYKMASIAFIFGSDYCQNITASGCLAVIGVDLYLISKFSNHIQLTSASGDVADGSLTESKLSQDLAEKINAKQEKLTLEVLSNGNIKIGNLNGQTKEFMPATPSGDPMHYAYEAMGAVYNSGADVIARTPWASLVDDADYNAKWGLNLIPNDATFVKTLKYGGVDREVWQMKHPAKTKLQIWVVADYASDGTKVWDDTLVVKRSGIWYFLGLGDLTNADMRTIMVESSPSITAGAFYHSNSRGIMFNRMLDIPVKALFQSSQAEVVKSNGFRPSKDSAFIFSMSNIEHILSGMELSNFSSFSDNALMLPDTIKTFDFIGINANITLSSPNITMKSIISAINKAGTKDITISLLPSLYERVMGNEEITNALSNKPNVNLAST